MLALLWPAAAAAAAVAAALPRSPVPAPPPPRHSKIACRSASSSMPATGYNIIPEADEHEERGAASKSIASGLANSRDRSPSKAKSKLHLSQ